MNWTIIWLDAALADVARHYLSGRAGVDPDAITRAMADADRLLAADPARAGESRAGNERLLVMPPLSVFFEVYAGQRTAVVTKVRYRQPS